MREFKFRAWSTISDGFIEPIVINGLTGRLVDSNAIVMQYTGLKDKNGKEIYEGDIVRNNHNANFYVFWQEDECRWRLLGSYGDEITGNSGIMFNARNLEGSEVIGNIMENPELLK